MDTFGRQLRKARQRAGMRVVDVANTLGVSRPYITNVERGIRAPLTPPRIDGLAGIGIETSLLHRAAAVHRGYVSLDISNGDALKLEVAALLADAWSRIPAPQLERIAKVLDNGS